MKKELLLGDGAVARAAIDAGISGVYAYPGTPSTEITEYIQAHARPGVHTDWCANEKTALEAALGVSYVGRRALVCMKHVGLNVAADAFINSAMSGVNGGLVVVVADDPSMHSSQNEQDSRFYGKFAFVPTLEPASQQEAYNMVGYAFELSEQLSLPVLVRLTTRMAHSRAVIEVSNQAKSVPPITFPKNPADWILLPVNARRRYKEVIDQWPTVEDLSENSPYNTFTTGTDKTLGIIASGIGVNYVMENFPSGCPYPILKISQYPLPKKLVRRLGELCSAILVVEDGQPFIEEQVRGTLPTETKITGRLDGVLPRVGELTPDNVRLALFGPRSAEGQAAKASDCVVARPPALCTGCGHRLMYEALNQVVATKADCKVFSDIGCYTLGALPPLRAINSCIDMGASITMAKGAADAGLHYSVAVIGDSTFTHSGMTGLLDAVNNKSAITVIISDNLTTAMTGGQDSAGTGRLEQICLGLGVEANHLHVVIPLPKNIEQITTIISSEIEYRGVSVIIPRRECIQTLKKRHKK
ncbi:MAG: thiamine pyrophosphate-dependent enzyme [Mucinivorans sp.]